MDATLHLLKQNHHRVATITGPLNMRVEGKAVAGCIVPLPAAGTKSVRVDVVLS